MVVGNLTPMDSSNYIYIYNIFNIRVFNNQNTMGTVEISDIIALVGLGFMLGICCALICFEDPDDYFLD